MKKHILGGSDRQQVCQPMLNPRLREESDLKNQINFISLSISIHAPVKRAIFRVQRRICILIFISIHAPVKGATGYIVFTFQSLIISIHAPVKGATRSVNWNELVINFNPRPREGSDEFVEWNCLPLTKFQSTPP